MAQLAEEEAGSGQAKEKAKPAVRQTKRKGSETWKKKKWFTIVAPKAFGEREIAETVSEKPQSVVGRTITLSVAEIVPQARKQAIYVNFKVGSVQGQKAFTELVGHQVSHGFLRRFTRRHTSKIDLVSDFECADNRKVRVTATTITAKKIPRKREILVRKAMAEVMAGVAKQKSSEELIYELIFGSAVNELGQRLQQICAVKRIEFAKSRIVGKKSRAQAKA